MEKQFLNYEQSLALKELRFNEPCVAYYQNNALVYTSIVSQNTNSFWINTNNIISAPLKQQAFKFFREKYNLHHVVIWNSDTNNFDAGLFGKLITPFLEEDTVFTSYEEAEEACINKLIEIVKEVNNEQ